MFKSSDKSGRAPVTALAVVVPLPPCEPSAAAVLGGRALTGTGASPGAAPAPATAAPCRPVDPAKPSLSAHAILHPDGIVIKTTGGNVAPGCTGPGEGVAVPMRADGAYDHDALRACLAKVKAATPEAAADADLVLAAGPGVPVAAVVGAMDAARTTPDGRSLLPNVAFGVAPPR